MNKFDSYHPIVSAIYFLSVLFITMFSINPILLLIALFGGIAFCAMMENVHSFWKNFGIYVPLFFLITIINPLFSHNGVTPLFFMNGNPVTLEAVLYGMDIAVMLIAVMYWFTCFNYIMTSDKLLFLLGKIFPKISLVVSSALRFIPLLKIQAKKIWYTQKAMGLFAGESWFDKLHGIMRVFSALITWSLENAIDTGASMKARGYGLKGRSHFALFKFMKTDGIVLSFIIVLDIIIFSSIAMGKMKFSFYPKISALEFGINTIPTYIAFGLLSFLPFILEIEENIKWTYYKSKI